MAEKLANPAPLGLLGFGMTTILLNIHNAGWYALGPMVLGMGIFVGGIAQLIAGMFEFKKNNTFAYTAFISYGLFWLSLVAILVAPRLGFQAESSLAMGWYLLIWGAFSFVMFLATVKHSKALQLVFLTLTFLFFMLAVSDFTGSSALKILAGYEGIICGILAMYTGLAEILNEIYQKKVWPLG